MKFWFLLCIYVTCWFLFLDNYVMFNLLESYLMKFCIRLAAECIRVCSWIERVFSLVYFITIVIANVNGWQFYVVIIVAVTGCILRKIHNFNWNRSTPLLCIKWPVGISVNYIYIFFSYWLYWVMRNAIYKHVNII